MPSCPNCGEKMNLFELEMYDDLYCERCGHEERRTLERRRPQRPLPPIEWRPRAKPKMRLIG